MHIEGKIDAILLSHAHLNHSGGINRLFADGMLIPICSLNVTRPLTELLLLGSVKVSQEK